MTPMFKVHDKVTRLDIYKPYIYTVKEIFEDPEGFSYTIVRHPSPNKPHWTISKEVDLILSE